MMRWGRCFWSGWRQLQEQLGGDDVELLTDFQLQIEHAVDLEGRALVLFVDASISCPPPYQFTRFSRRVIPAIPAMRCRPPPYCTSISKCIVFPPPPAFQLAIRGEHFELGEPLSAAAAVNLEAALAFTERLLARPDVETWQQWTSFGAIDLNHNQADCAAEH
jgi:hypothetical protein